MARMTKRKKAFADKVQPGRYYPIDEALSLACAIWRDTWTDNRPLAEHAKAFIELKWQEARRRNATNARP